MAFPAISCGIFGYPIEKAATIALATLAEALRENPTVEKIKMVLFDEDTHRVFMQVHTLLGS